MFNRLLTKRQCVRPFSAHSRNICGLSRPTHPVTPSPVHCHISALPSFLSHIRHFGTTIKTYNQPDVGEGTVEVDILEWNIAPGDEVSMLQTIGRGKYEKADIDILAPAYSGIVHKICVPAGQVAIVGQPLVEFEVEDDAATADTPSETPTNIASSTITKQTS